MIIILVSLGRISHFLYNNEKIESFCLFQVKKKRTEH